MVKARQAISPTIWLVTGDPFADTALAVLSDGAAPVALLSRAGVDAVVLTPEWLSFGLPRLSDMISRGRYYALSASLVDRYGQTIGHPFMVRKSGAAIVALTGIALDSAAVLTHLAGANYVVPAMAAAKALALMRQRADLVGVMVEPRAAGKGWGADFTVNLTTTGASAMVPSADSSRVNCYDVNADASRLTAHTTELSQFLPDTVVRQLLDSVKLAADSVAGRPLPRGRSNARSLSSALIAGVLAAEHADGFLCDSLFVPTAGEPATVGDLVAGLRDPGRLALLKVAGGVLAGWPVELTLRPGLSRSRLSRNQTYRIGTTVDYLRRHRVLALPGFELSDRPFWTICRDVLESGQGK
jgi:hypothetical protein